jgi:hypothetical protein
MLLIQVSNPPIGKHIAFIHVHNIGGDEITADYRVTWFEGSRKEFIIRNHKRIEGWASLLRKILEGSGQ